MDKRDRLPYKLLIIWLVFVFIYSIGSSVYVSYQQVFVGNDPTVFVSGYHWVTFGVLLLFFLPLLCVIHHLAKKTAADKLYRVVSVLLIWAILLVGLFLLCIVFAYVAPDKFAKLTSP